MDVLLELERFRKTVEDEMIRGSELSRAMKKTSMPKILEDCGKIVTRIAQVPMIKQWAILFAVPYKNAMLVSTNALFERVAHAKTGVMSSESFANFMKNRRM